TPNSNGGYNESVVYAFPGGAGGQSPEVTPLLDSSGAIYGTTLEGGGSRDYGIFFKLIPSGSQFIVANLYIFQGGRDGASPWAGLVALQGGVIVGATLSGGSKNQGTIFEMKPHGSSYTESVRYAFKGGKKDGSAPYGTLLVGNDGLLYGTTGNAGLHAGGIALKVKP
ncbi:MAG TPA: choice-of-anchor tandem repeat GloVer-containing protein, partial [Candidatus Nitrosotalea sp.]|nr:choice-of-anchor tandem repeat GloVer-containing protein [Candidatus Nitrosotalea sp.]